MTIKDENIVKRLYLDDTNNNIVVNGELTSSWLSPDPLAHKYTSWSPYAYCAGNPVNFVAPDGRCVRQLVDYHPITESRFPRGGESRTCNLLRARVLSDAS